MFFFHPDVAPYALHSDFTGPPSGAFEHLHRPPQQPEDVALAQASRRVDQWTPGTSGGGPAADKAKGVQGEGQGFLGGWPMWIWERCWDVTCFSIVFEHLGCDV